MHIKGIIHFICIAYNKTALELLQANKNSLTLAHTARDTHKRWQSSHKHTFVQRWNRFTYDRHNLAIWRNWNENYSVACTMLMHTFVLRIWIMFLCRQSRFVFHFYFICKHNMVKGENAMWFYWIYSTIILSAYNNGGVECDCSYIACNAIGRINIVSGCKWTSIIKN